MTRFFRRDPDGAWDLDDFKLRTAELADFVARAARGLRLEQAGGARLFQRRQHRLVAACCADPIALAGAILMRAMLPFDPRPLPDLGGLPVLILAGNYDELIPVDRAGLLAALLGEAGADVTYEMLPAGHGLTERRPRLAAEWLAHR